MNLVIDMLLTSHIYYFLRFLVVAETKIRIPLAFLSQLLF